MKAYQIEGWMTEGELNWLAERARAAKTIIEIGSFKGRSTRALADNVARNGVVYAVDLWSSFDTTPAPAGDEYFAAFKRNVADLIADGKVVPIRSDSLLWSPDLRDVDMVFLDGGHDEARVTSEILKYGPMLRDGGLLCGHDFGNHEHPGVAAAVSKWVPGFARASYSIWWAELKRGAEPWL